jgi:NSS family neurotransmitter:Na+ symporter
MPGGHMIAILFFTLLSVAAVTSMVGLLEPLVAWLEDVRDYSRQKSTLVTVACIACLGVLSILSYNLLSQWQIVSQNLNGILDFLANQIMLPVGGLLIAIFAAWQVSKASLRNELPAMSDTMFEAWHLLLRFLLPPAIAVIIITGLL